MSIRKPMVLVLAGPNGSGKSTITRYFEKVGEYTNADDIVLSTGMDNFEAAKLVDEKRYNSISNKKDFTFETEKTAIYIKFTSIDAELSASKKKSHNLEHQQENKHEQSEYLFSPDVTTTKSESAKHGNGKDVGFWSDK